MNRLWNDLRYGFRMLLKTPGATVTVLIALSLGIGLSTLTFTLINGAVRTELPYEDGDRIVRIGRTEVPVTIADYMTWSSRQRSFEHIGALETSTVTLAVEGFGSEPVLSASITPSVLRLLPEAPALGRPFTEEDAAAGAPAVVLVSHDIWRDRLGSSPGALGRTVRVNGRPAQVVGVMPDGFGFPWDQRLWLPLHLDPLRGDAGGAIATEESKFVVGRLRQGVTPEAAGEELTALAREVDQQSGRGAGRESIVRVVNYTELFGESGQSAALAALMLGVAFLVLLVACANVANVLLARAIDRSREVAIRVAIGASRLRIIAQLLTEISLLAAAGAAGGVIIALIGTRFVRAVSPPGMPYWMDFRIDPATIGFVVIVGVLAALMAGLMPSLQASRSNTHELLKDTTRGSSSSRVGQIMRRLISVEMAVSFVLLVVAGLFIKSAVNFRATDFAFEPEEVYTALARVPETTYADASAQARFAEQLLETLRSMPQVTDAALATAVPGVGSAPVISVEVNSEVAGEGVRTRSIVVTPGFFELFRASITSGRDFDSRDRTGTLPVAIVNEAFARKYFPGGALDRSIRYTERGGEEKSLTIVGVTTDLMAGGVEGELPEAIYLPVAQNAQSELTIIARPRDGFSSVTAPVRESVAALDPDVALYRILPLDKAIDLANSQYTWFSLVFLISGGISLFLAALGLYGVMAFWVIQRTREIGVRMALGGQRRDIVRLVLSQAMTQTSIGLAVGVLLAIPAARLLSFALFGVTPYDPLVFGGILTVLIAAALLGCWLPARRATRMDPLKALVAE
jgi:putative ABC transport system permease protein